MMGMDLDRDACAREADRVLVLALLAKVQEIENRGYQTCWHKQRGFWQKVISKSNYYFQWPIPFWTFVPFGPRELIEMTMEAARGGEWMVLLREFLQSATREGQIVLYSPPLVRGRLR